MHQIQNLKVENIFQNIMIRNEFFSLLDKSLTYSSAIYKKEKDDLEIAQKNKFQELINLLNMKNEQGLDRCGWGDLLNS